MNTAAFRLAARRYATGLLTGVDCGVALHMAEHVLSVTGPELTTPLNPALAREVALDVAYRLAPNTEQARYERLLALHDWRWRESTTLADWHAGKAERDYLEALSIVLDKSKRVWNDYSLWPCVP